MFQTDFSSSELLDTNHKHKVQITNVKMELTKNRGDLERERDSLKLECDSLRNKITVLDNTVEHLNVVIGEKVSSFLILLPIRSGKRLFFLGTWFRTKKFLNNFMRQVGKVTK